LALLRPLGAAVVLLPAPKNRFGTRAFPASLNAAGLAFRVYEVRDAALLAGLEEASFFTWHAYLAWRPGGADAAWPSAWHAELAAALAEAAVGGPSSEALVAQIAAAANLQEPMLAPWLAGPHEKGAAKGEAAKGAAKGTAAARARSAAIGPAAPQATRELPAKALGLLSGARLLPEAASHARRPVPNTLKGQEAAAEEEDTGNAVGDAAIGFLAGFDTSDDEDEAESSLPAITARALAVK
jgi:hypothetical protein